MQPADLLILIYIKKFQLLESNKKPTKQEAGARQINLGLFFHRFLIAGDILIGVTYKSESEFNSELKFESF